MKTRLFLRNIALATAGLLSYSAQSQAQSLPPNFQSQKQLEYNNLPVKEISFADFYQVETAKYQRKQTLILDPSLIYCTRPRSDEYLRQR